MLLVALLIPLGLTSLVFLLVLGRAAIAQRAIPKPEVLGLGAVVCFFDTLGIGSFATTTSTYRLLKLVPDERIPGTMLVGHTLPVVVQAFAFISVVSVDRTLLVSLIVAMMVGGWLGAGVVSRLPRRVIQLRMATGLLLAGVFMAVGMLGLYPTGGQALALGPGRLAIAWMANFVFGALATLGIGNYGPSLILFSLLGLDPRWKPRFARRYAALGAEAQRAFGAYAADVRAGAFPADEESFE